MRRDRGRFMTACSVALLALLLGGTAGWVRADDEEDLPRGWREFVEPIRASGGVGRAFVPSVYAGPQAGAILDPTGWEVHLASPDVPGDERIHPAGELFVPPPGRWWIWLQGPDGMSEFVHLIGYPGSLGLRSSGSSVKTSPVGPAGRVVLPDGAGARAGQELWVIHADSPGGHHFEFSRRRPAAEAADEGIAMPTGTALAALWDRDDERYVALSRPFAVRTGAEVPAPLEEPAPERAHLLLYASRPDHVDAEPLFGLAPTVARGAARRPPDATVVTNWGVYCTWYDLPAGPAVLADGNRRVYLEPRTVDLPAGEVVRMDATLLDRPFLDVGLLLPARVRERAFSLAVRRMPQGEELATIDLRREAGRYRFESLVQAPLEVVLYTHLGLFRERVDLTGLTEGFVTLEPSLIELSGRVHRDGEPQPAEIELVTDFGDRVKAGAGEDGAYRALALQPIRAVSVRLPGTTGDPWVHAFERSITESRELDLELPPAGGERDPAAPAAPDVLAREPATDGFL